MKYILFVLLVFIGFQASAQQIPAFANSYVNRMVYNPAQSYSEDRQLEILALNRNQWVGLDGAPSIQFLQVQYGLPDQNIGIGGQLMYDQAGPFRVSRVGFNFSYKLNMDEAQYLVVGLSTSMTHNLLGLYDLDLIENGDDLFSRDIASGTNFNFGFGMHFRVDALTLDVSVPRLLKNRIFSSQALSEDDSSKESGHYFFAARYEMSLNSDLLFKPSVVLRMVSESPVSFDFSANVVYKELFEIAPFVRFGESIGLQGTYFVTPQLYAGYSYEFGTSQLRNYNSGSHEFFIGFRQAFEKGKSSKKSKPKKDAAKKKE